MRLRSFKVDPGLAQLCSPDIWYMVNIQYAWWIHEEQMSDEQVVRDAGWWEWNWILWDVSEAVWQVITLGHCRDIYQILEVRFSDGQSSIPGKKGMTRISAGEKIISQRYIFQSLPQGCQHHNHYVLIYNVDFWASSQALLNQTFWSGAEGICL